MASTISARRLAEALPTTDFSGPAYRALYDGIRLLIIDGRIADGTRLPSERELATALGVSRTTTTRVYAELRDAELLESRQGSGSIVRLPLSQSSTSSLMADSNDPDTIALTYSAPVGPPGLARAFERAAERLPGLLATTGYLPDGLPALREMIAARYADSGLPTDPDQIVVTNGAMGALSLAARTLLSPGERVLVEGLSYPHGTDAFAAAGGRLSPLAVGDTPWDPEQIESILRQQKHSTAYLISDFHNPTAAVMDDATRSALAASFRRYGVTAVIDESLRDINLDGIDMPPHFAHYDPNAILLGSFIQARMIDDLGSSAFDQLVLAELFDDGGQTAAASRARGRAARDHLLGELAHTIPEIEAPCPPGGLNLWVTLPQRISSQVVTAAAPHGLLLTPGPRFFTSAPSAGERHLRLPFTLSHEQLTEAVHRLRASIGDVLQGVQPRAVQSTPDRLDLIA